MIQTEGFAARIETLNATEAYLGSLLGNWYAKIREPSFYTRNLAVMVPVNSCGLLKPKRLARFIRKVRLH